MQELTLNLQELPRYIESSFRSFLPKERHVNRLADYDVLLLLLDGALIFHEDGQRRELRAGDWYIQRAGRRQEGREPSLLPHYYYIHFHGSFRRDRGLPLEGSFPPEQLRQALGGLDLAEKNGLSLVERCRWFYEILSLLHGAGQESACPVVGQMQAYIAAHYMERLRVSDLAKRFSYSQDHVIRLFRAHLGITPHDYIGRVRLAQAQQMLTTTNRSVQTIAAQTGFSDPTVLFRAFVRETGLSPTAWRERQRAR